jgi:hypothetical protein
MVDQFEDVFAQLWDDGKMVEELMIREPDPEPFDPTGTLTEHEKELVAKIMTRAAFKHDDALIERLENWIYKRLWGDSWYEDEVWMDIPLNWADLDLVSMAKRDYLMDDIETDEELYTAIYEEALHLIDDVHDVCLREHSVLSSITVERGVFVVTDNLGHKHTLSEWVACHNK